MKTTSLILGLFIASIIIITSCTKTKIETVTVTKIDTLNLKDTTVQLLPDTISFLAGGSPYTLTNYSALTTESLLGWNGNPAIPYHILAFQAQDSFNNIDGNAMNIEIFTTNGSLLSNKTYGALGDTTSGVIINFYNDTMNVNGNYYGSVDYPSISPTVTITSINGNAISGTFQGALYYNADTTGNNKTVVTNGRFSAFY
jgi:hypothetical protein